MASRWMEPKDCRNLAVLVESVTAPLLIEHDAPVCLEMDVDVSLPIPGDNQCTADLIKSLCLQALAAMPDGGDLIVTACDCAGGMELEIADCGADVSTRERHIPFAAAAIDAQLKWENCPQGGVAVTILFPANTSADRLAA